MTDQELLKIRGQITEAVNSSVKNPQASVSKLSDIKNEIGKKYGKTSIEYYHIASMTHEASGDIWVKAKKILEAEREFLEMMRLSVKAYELNKEKFDYSLGFSYFKRASFYRNAIQCNSFSGKPKELKDNQKKMYEVAESFYKNAIACTMDKAKKGILKYVELHVLVMGELLTLYAAVGNYELAVKCGRDAVKMEKAIYEKADNKANSFRLGRYMDDLALVYTISKDVQQAMETYEDAIFVLEEHESEDPVVFGVILSKNYLNLAGCYAQIKEERANAEETCQKGLKKILEANKKSNGRLVEDVLISHMFAGDFYKRIGKLDIANSYYRKSLEFAELLLKKTNDKKYEKMIEHLKGLL